ANTKALSDNSTNETVVGYNAIGGGNNTVSIGNTSVISSRLRGRILQGGVVDNLIDSGQFSGSVLATGFKTASGTASQFLKANGSVDSNTYLTSASLPTVDQTIIDGSTNAVSSNAVFDGLATKAPISSVHNPVTLGTANGLSLATQQLSLGLASSGVTGALSGTDWNTFNSKQPALGFTPENVANKQNSLDTDATGTKYPTVTAVKNAIDAVNSALGVVQKDIAYVDVNGNNTTGVLGNIRKAFLTIDAALDALPATGGVVKIGIGSFNSPTSAKIKSNTSFIGAKEPVINSTVTISAPNTRPTITSPTALINGTILTGEFSALDKNNIVVSNLGVDVGKTWIDTFNGGVSVGGLVIASITSTSPIKNIYVSNVTVLGYAPATAQHCMLFENIIDSKFDNLTTYYHVHGIALKGLNITMNGLNLYSHNNDGLIIKSDIYAPTRDISVNNVNINSLYGYEGGGIILEEGVNGSSLLERVSLNNVNLKYVKFGLNNVNKVSSVNISNFNLYDSNTFGIKFDNNVDKINLSGINIVKTTTDGIDVSITGTEVVNIVNSSISDATGIGYKLTTAGNALININNSNTLNTAASYAIIGTGVYGSSNFGTGSTTGYINFKNNFVKSNGRIFSTDDSFFGDLASTNGTLDMRFSNASQIATIEAYNFTTALMKPLEIKSLNLLLTALKGTGNRLVVADTNGNLSTTNLDQRPYKVYTALLSQTGTNAPTATVLENTLGGTVVWSRTGVGIYNATLSGAFTTNKTIIFISQPVYNWYETISLLNTSVLNSNTRKAGTLSDDVFSNTSIEIRVYL
ncbi:MAG: hypothetical protein WBP57_06055, partial [Ignavibacteria bacterium]